MFVLVVVVCWKVLVGELIIVNGVVMYMKSGKMVVYGMFVVDVLKLFVFDKVMLK